MIEYLDLLMFATLMVAVLSGFPVAFSIAGTAIIFAFLGWYLGAMNISLLGAMSQRIFGLLTNGVLIAIPLFVLMGAVLEKSRIAEDMLDTMGRSFIDVALLSIMDSVAAETAGPALSSMLIYILMAIILAIKPSGLFPPKGA